MRNLRKLGSVCAETLKNCWLCYGFISLPLLRILKALSLFGRVLVVGQLVHATNEPTNVVSSSRRCAGMCEFSDRG